MGYCTVKPSLGCFTGESVCQFELKPKLGCYHQAEEGEPMPPSFYFPNDQVGFKRLTLFQDLNGLVLNIPFYPPANGNDLCRWQQRLLDKAEQILQKIDSTKKLQSSPVSNESPWKNMFASPEKSAWTALVRAWIRLGDLEKAAQFAIEYETSGIYEVSISYLFQGKPAEVNKLLEMVDKEERNEIRRQIEKGFKQPIKTDGASEPSLRLKSMDDVKTAYILLRRFNPIPDYNKYFKGYYNVGFHVLLGHPRNR